MRPTVIQPEASPPSPAPPRPRGDQRVRVVVEIPTYITQAQKQLIEEFQSLEEPDAQPKVRDFQKALDDLYE